MPFGGSTTCALPIVDPPGPPPEDPIAADRRRRELREPVRQQRRLQPSSRWGASGWRRPVRPRWFDRAGVRTGSLSRRDRAGCHSRVRGLTCSDASLSKRGACSGAESGPDRRSRIATDAGADTPINAGGPTHTVLEGTTIDAVLTNRLDGSGVAPVNCLVTNPVFSHSGQHVLIPAGARILGETRPVQALGETRLAVSFHRLAMPDGSTHRLDHFMRPEPDWRRGSAAA